jgi:hypothetical protein
MELDLDSIPVVVPEVCKEARGSMSLDLRFGKHGNE